MDIFSGRPVGKPGRPEKRVSVHAQSAKINDRLRLTRPDPKKIMSNRLLSQIDFNVNLDFKNFEISQAEIFSFSQDPARACSFIFLIGLRPGSLVWGPTWIGLGPNLNWSGAQLELVWGLTWIGSAQIDLGSGPNWSRISNTPVYIKPPLNDSTSDPFTLTIQSTFYIWFCQYSTVCNRCSKIFPTNLASIGHNKEVYRIVFRPSIYSTSYSTHCIWPYLHVFSLSYIWPMVESWALFRISQFFRSKSGVH